MVRAPLIALLLCWSWGAYAEDPVIGAGPPPPANDRCAPGRRGQWSQLPPPPVKEALPKGRWWNGALVIPGKKILRFDPCQGRWGQITSQEEILKLVDFDQPVGGVTSYLVQGVRVVPAVDNTRSVDVFAGGSVRLLSGAKIPMPAAGAPEPRSWFALAVADGKVVVWGGHTGEQGPVADGAVLDPKRPAAWKPMSMEGAPHRRVMPLSAWTGQRLLIWGGADAEDAGAPLEPRADGAQYDPKADRWTPMSQDGAPSPRMRPLAVWTGRDLLVLGGGPALIPGAARGAIDAGLYDPAANRWRPVTGVPADLPEVQHWIHAFVDPHGDVLMLTTFGRTHLYFLDRQKAALEEIPLPPELQDRVEPGFAWSGKRLFLWGGRAGPERSRHPTPPEPASDAWVYEPP